MVLIDDDYIIRSITNNYSSYTLKLDVITWRLNGDAYEYCLISDSFDEQFILICFILNYNQLKVVMI